jgi:hypothetical protein
MMAGPAGVEPTTPGLKVRCSILAELRARAVLFRVLWEIKFIEVI